MVAAPSAEAWSFRNVNNGSRSTNRISVRNHHINRYEQTNSVFNMTHTEIEQDSGDNEVKDNTTSGDESGETLKTGKNSAVVTVVNTSGSNDLMADDCGCESDDEVTAVNKDNGSRSKNSISLRSSYRNIRVQDNWIKNMTGTEVDQDSGDNEVEDNTTSGDDSGSSLSTGNNTVDVYVENTSGMNVQ